MPEQVPVVTTAPTSQSEDLARRQRRHVAVSAVRAACLLAVLVVPFPKRGKIVLAAATAALSGFGAVLSAEAPRSRAPHPERP